MLIFSIILLYPSGATAPKDLTYWSTLRLLFASKSSHLTAIPLSLRKCHFKTVRSRILCDRQENKGWDIPTSL